MIAGGGSTFTPGIVMMLLEHADEFPIRQIKFYDNNEERQDKVAKLVKLLFVSVIQKLTLSQHVIQKKHLQM